MTRLFQRKAQLSFNVDDPGPADMAGTTQGCRFPAYEIRLFFGRLAPQAVVEMGNPQFDFIVKTGSYQQMEQRH